MEGKQQNSFFGILITLAITYVYREFILTVDGPIVNTSLGSVQSIVSKSRVGRKYYEFLGIPYARPPVGELRFEPPVPAEPWNGVRKGNKLGPECLQMEVMVTGRLLGEEDCLYLNVYTPKIERNAQKSLLPVMVFIHGGLFHAGSATMYRAKYFMDEDVVLVTLNYRLAALGFLNTGDQVARGNQGLKDQNMALKWVQKNIRGFGGDPNQVTIFGESAGGASVHYHMLSPASKGLFQKALSQSGTALKNWALTKDPSEQARRLGVRMNCRTNSSAELVSCLKRADGRKLVQLHLAIMSALRDPLDTFVPSVEAVVRPDTFLSEDPLVLAKAGKFSPVPWLTGVNAGEGLINMGRILTDSKLISRMDQDWAQIAPILLSYESSNLEAAEEIRTYYFGNTLRLNPVDAVENFTKLLSDRNFFQGTHKAAILHSQKAPVYLYYLTYPGEISLFNLFKWISPDAQLPVELQVTVGIIKELFYKYILGITSAYYGPCHADELPLLFNMHYFADITKNSRDYYMSRSLVRLWTNFAKDDRHLKYKNTLWEPANSNQTQAPLKYMNLNQYGGGLIDEPFTNRLRFWDSLHI